MEGRGEEGEGAMTTTPKFTEAEVQAILTELDSGTALTHELAARYPNCEPSDIWALWEEQHRKR